MPPSARKNHGQVKGVVEGLAPLMQLPHADLEVAKKLGRKRVRSLAELAALAPEERGSVLESCGLRPDQVRWGWLQVPSHHYVARPLPATAPQPGGRELHLANVWCHAEGMSSRRKLQKTFLAEGGTSAFGSPLTPDTGLCHHTEVPSPTVIFFLSSNCVWRWDTQVQEVQTSLASIPSVTLSEVKIEVEGEDAEHEIMQGDLVTCSCRVVLTRPNHATSGALV